MQSPKSCASKTTKLHVSTKCKWQGVLSRVSYYDVPKAREKILRNRFFLPTLIPPAEKLTPGNKLLWPTWRALDRLCTQVGRCGENV